MRPSHVAILALTAATLAGCSTVGLGSEVAPAKPAVAAAAPAQAAPIAPVGSVQAQPLPPAAAASAPLTQPGPPTPPVAAASSQQTQSPGQSTPSGPALGAVLGGPVGASLPEIDRQAAWNAQIAALDSGQSRSWRGAHGVFGFIAPGAETGGGCRAYSQTIYVAGRPKRGQGVACKLPDGTWKMTS